MRSLQEPIHSGFSAASTARDVLQKRDLSGQVAIVTGGYSGIGLETTRALIAAGAKVVVPARNRDKAMTALQGLNGVEIEAMDLADPAPSMPSRKGSARPAGLCTCW
ncbi:MAG: short chain dehydrogenase family protein [Rhizobacter sp.]|nr:short chain dehydrogenase family protein [Rhizobacter sp.]